MTCKRCRKLMAEDDTDRDQVKAAKQFKVGDEVLVNGQHYTITSVADSVPLGGLRQGKRKRCNKVRNADRQAPATH